MALGPGKYDDLCTYVREQAHADGVIVIVINGKFGPGFSCQATADVTARLADILRTTASMIDGSFGQS